MFNVQIIRKNVKNITLKIKNDGSVTLTAPILTDMKYINDILLANKDKILNKLTNLKKNRPSIPIKIDNGSHVYYLGRCYQLKIVHNENHGCFINGDFFELHTNNSSDNHLNLTIIYNWYIHQAKCVYNELIHKYKHFVKKDVKKITIKKMNTRWGSCNIKTSAINLNLNLMLYPIEAIEYVILHELTHLIHYNHDKNFYSFIEQIMPDWKIRKSLLV